MSAHLQRSRTETWAARDQKCARHGCPHTAGDHADIRVGARPWYWGHCRITGCLCAEFIVEPVCDPAQPVFVAVSPSGVRYERCACGIQREVRPEEAHC